MFTLRQSILSRIATLETSKQAVESEIAAQKAALSQHEQTIGSFLDAPLSDALVAWRWLGSHLLNVKNQPAAPAAVANPLTIDVLPVG